METPKRMTRTFEERVSEELDALYAGAVFLSGGDEAMAHDLVVEAVRLASAEYSELEIEEPFGQWMEGMMIRPLLSSGSQAPTRSGPVRVPAAADDVSGDDPDGFQWRNVTGAAATIPRSARVAIWLVVLRRWSYDRAQEAMGLGRESLRELLAFRADLFKAVSAEGRAGDVRGTGS